MIQAVLQATFVSKCVLALLLCMSVASWAYMCSKWMLLRTAQHRWELHPGDVVAYAGDQAHTYSNPGQVPAVAITVIGLLG